MARERVASVMPVTPRVRPFFRWALGLALFVLAVYVSYAAWDYAEARALTAAMDKARGLTSITGPGAPPANEFADDPVRLYMAAGTLIPYRPQLPFLDRAFRETLDTPPTAEEMAAATAILKESDLAFELVARARSATVRRTVFRQAAPLSGLFRIVSLLSFRTHVLARAGRIEQATTSLLDQLLIVRIFDNLGASQPGAYGYRQFILNASISDTEWLLRLSPLPVETLTELSRLLAVDTAGDYGVPSFALQQILEGRPLRSSILPPLSRRRVRHLVDLSVNVVEAWGQSWPDRLRKLEVLEAGATERSLMPLIASEKRFFGSALASAQNAARATTRLRATQVALAIERYRQTSSRLPDDLSELAPAYLREVPVDPFSGGPVHYRRDAVGYRVYGLGTNGKDDGGDFGRLAWDAANQRYGPDVGVRITR